MTLGQSPPFTDSKVQLLKHRILRRTAEILLATGYESEEHLRQILPAQGPDSGQLLAMQVFVLSRRGPDDLMKLCGKINGSSEATLVYWNNLEFSGSRTGFHPCRRRYADRLSVLDEIRSKIAAAQSIALPSSELSKACQYSLTLWKKLTRFLEYPELELSTIFLLCRPPVKNGRPVLQSIPGPV